MKITEFDTSKPKNRKRIRALQRQCEIEISEFPRSSRFEEIIDCCNLIERDSLLIPEVIGRSSVQGVNHVLHTMRSIGLINSEDEPNESLRAIVRQSNTGSKMRELAVIVSRSPWLRRWIEWSEKESIFEMEGVSARPFLESVSHGKDSYLRTISSNMNSILKQAIANHPSKDSLDRPDILPWNQLQRLEHYSEPIYEPEKLIPAMKRVSEDSSFVRQGTGYISLQGYDLLARNLSRADVRLLVGSNDVKGRMEVSNSLDGFRDSIQKGPMSSWKIDSAKRMRKEMINGTMRVRCLKARHLPDHHAKVQIYDGSAAILGSANLSWNGFVKNIEGSYVVVGESDVRYFVERFDEYFTEATPIEAELLEILDKSWPIRSEELVDPNDVYLRILLEMYGDSGNERSPENISLADYQEYSVNKSLRDLHEHMGSLLVAPTGTGKTLMGTFVAHRLHQKRKIDRIFVITKNGQISDIWRKAFLDFGLPYEPIPLSVFREQKGGWKKTLEGLKKSLNEKDLILIDECHHVMNDSKGKKNLLSLLDQPKQKTPYKLLLTATPMSKGLEDFNNLLNIVHSSVRASKSSDVATLPSVTYLTHPLIAQRFAHESESGHRYVIFSGVHRFFAKKTTEQVRYDSNLLDELIETLIELPLETINHLPDGQMTIDGSGTSSDGRRNELVRAYLSTAFESSPVQGLSAINDMLNQDLSAIYFHSDELRTKLELAKSICERILSNDSKLKKSIEHVREALNSEGKILIFCQYKNTVRYLKEKLEENFDVIIETLTGEDSDSRKEEVCARFSPKCRGLRSRKTDPQILIATDCLSEGVDLQDASLMVNYDLFWTPLKLVQRVGRLDRPTPDRRSFKVANILPKGQSFNNLFGMQTRLNERSNIYRKMAGIDVFSDNIRDLDNLDVESAEHLKEMLGDNPDLAYEKYMDQFATKVLGQLARASEEDKIRARALPLGATSNYESRDGTVGILSVFRDGNGYPHVISEHYEETWKGVSVEANDQEQKISLGYPYSDAESISIRDEFYDRHELMLANLARKYDFDIEEITPVANLIKS